MYWRMRNALGPLLLIGLGVVLLLNNLDVLAWDVWETIWRLWPVVLILIGLDFLIGWRVGSGTVAEIDQALAGATQAEVEISPGISALHIGALADPDRLIAGTVAVGRGQTVTPDFRRDGDTARFRLKSRGAFVLPFSGGWRRGVTWDLRLNPDVPTRLKVDAGVGRCALDLTDLQLTELDIDSGVGQVGVTLPRRGRLRAEVEGGVGEVTVKIPAGMAARVRVSAGLGSARVHGDFQRQGDVYVSPGYDTAENRVDLRVEGGVGAVTVRELQGL